MRLGVKLSRAVMSPVGPPIANRSSVMGQTKGGSPTHHEDDTIKVVYVTQIGITGDSGLGLELAGEHLVAQPEPTGPGLGAVQTGMACTGAVCAKQLGGKLAPPNPRPWLLTGKGWFFHLRSMERLCLR